MTRPVERVYLDVPFAEKDRAKSLGAQFDRTRHQWWVAAEIAQRRLKTFARWTPLHPFSLSRSLRNRTVGVVCPGCGTPSASLCWRCRPTNPQS